MKRKILVHDEARYDAIDVAYYIAENDLAHSDRFAEAVDATYEQLAEMPGLGVRRDYNNPRLKGMRMWAVPEFPKYLIFYQFSDTELTILRILHSSRDMEGIFAPDEDKH